MNQSLNTSSNTINVSQLPTGLYFFKVSSNEGITTSKIVKQ
ncbi:T9SS type A sorting domain-containing protein [Flavobacterium jejuense]|uniref:T9SS type A sorting domain-containing protein n=1 Tax=Flavobacterium jejuense TaxID=1544455 RepID=A0ABX0IW66_9FLAO|nr:T9SS type A sorting domain-containing protein [Flavobacterium jejuense]